MLIYRWLIQLNGVHGGWKGVIHFHAGLHTCDQNVGLRCVQARRRGRMHVADYRNSHVRCGAVLGAFKSCRICDYFSVNASRIPRPIRMPPAKRWKN
jgi:hypothetical protein